MNRFFATSLLLVPALIATDPTTANAQAPCTISQQLSNGSSAANAPDGVGQSFRACGEGVVTRIRVECSLLSNPSVILGIQPGYGVAAPTYSENLTFGTGVRDIVLATPFPVQAGQLYSFALFATGGLIGLRDQDNDPYSGGAFFFMTGSRPGGSSSNPDLKFEVQIEIDNRASCEFRNGSGVNPTGYDCITAPIIGANWDTTITTNASTMTTFMGITPSGTTLPFAGGELLIDPSFAPLFLPSGSGSFSLPIPNSGELIGGQLATQGFRVDLLAAQPTLILLNAQDVKIGL